MEKMNANPGRIPCQPFCPEPVSTKFTLENAFSALDFLVAARDIVLALKHLFMEHKILHKHIAYNNLLVQSAGDEGVGVKGLVIDLDFPNPTEGSSREHQGFSACNSFLFQSAQQLVNYGVDTRMHRFQDDFESVFYALCWACYGFDHTGRPDKFRPAWMTTWEGKRAPTWPNKRQASPFGYDKSNFKREPIPVHVNRYVGCHRDILESVIEELRESLVACVDNELEAAEYYDTMLKILEDGMAKVKGEPCGFGLECSKGTASVVGAASAKRRFCDLERLANG
ncbi:hypothetical protein FB451DRAFT_1566156 [Mycena latifolia]|nr:hypothetical protein FB451DRAFT_1566156 [Mycena latifolia]